MRNYFKVVQLLGMHWPVFSAPISRRSKLILLLIHRISNALGLQGATLRPRVFAGRRVDRILFSSVLLAGLQAQSRRCAGAQELYALSVIPVSR